MILVVRTTVKNAVALAFLLVLAGCMRRQTKELVQGAITITPPLQRLEMLVAEDGGSVEGHFKDAKGRMFQIFIDYRLGTKTPGAVYLGGEPGDPKAVFITNGAAIKQMLGVR